MTIIKIKEEILALITTLKLTEKEIHSLEEEAGKWKKRAELAFSSGKEDLAASAESETKKINEKLAWLREEERSFRENIDALRRQLPGLAAKERSIDPDVLEQELLMALGCTEEETETEKAFRELEKESGAGAALEALKAKMKENKTQN